MTQLRDAFARKADEFADVIKMGRTQLQDAVPMTLGQEFSAWALMVTEDIHRVQEAQSLICVINMGATAIGTGLNAHPDYPRLVTEKLRLLTGIPVIAYTLFTSLDMLGRACRTLADRCVVGITANREVCRWMVEHSIGLVIALNPYIGYEKSTQLAEEALTGGRSVYEIVLEKGDLSQAELDGILSPENMTKPRHIYPKRLRNSSDNNRVRGGG